MKQVVQNFKTGKLAIEDVPAPTLGENMVLVENKFSLISSGTEKGTVKVGKASLLNKARQRPDLVNQVLKNLKKEGLRATIDKVNNKLDAPKALGYSTSGVVLASTDSGGLYKPGDKVACAGQGYASHAEVVSIPQNLVCKIPDNVTFEEASFTTIGAIALQGIRQANPNLGDNVCVIGLGLLGQISCQILRANGCNVAGIDIDDYNVELAKNHSADLAINRNNETLVSQLSGFSGGKGFDSVIITAATSSSDPIDLACEVLRRKGVMVIVGVVAMNIQREPHFYKKELELKISCSYGPGRYDPTYEEKGLDYPIDYVRYTEQRNMEAFLGLIARKRIDLAPFITQIFPVEKAGEAYQMVLGNTDKKFTGLLLKYSENKTKSKTLISKTHREISNKINIGFIGAGSFATSYLIPNLSGDINLDTVVTGKGINADSVAKKFNFQSSSSNADDIFQNKNINTLFIATRHNTHASFVMKGLKSGKNIFVEKPLCLNVDELYGIEAAYRESNSLLMVGFNRRYSPVVEKIKQHFNNSSSQKIVNIRVNAGKLPADHWALDKDIGGGRIIGELCHFVDFLQAITGSIPKKVSAAKISARDESTLNEDNVSVQLEMSDGSLGSIVYTSIGSEAMAKEYIEVFSDGLSCVIDDFKTITLYKESSSKKVSVKSKGHKEEVKVFLEAAKGNTTAPDFKSVYATSLTTFKIQDALITGLPQSISD